MLACQTGSFSAVNSGESGRNGSDKRSVWSGMKLRPAPRGEELRSPSSSEAEEETRAGGGSCSQTPLLRARPRPGPGASRQGPPESGRTVSQSTICGSEPGPQTEHLVQILQTGMG